MAWESTPLKKITTKIGSGATPRGGQNSYKTEGITLIRSLNVYDFEFSYEGLAFITEGQASETRLARVIVEPKDILLNITGASVARCCMVPEHLRPARVNQHVSLVRVDPNRADSHYVLYCINSPVYKHHLLALAQGGTTREALTKEIIGNFEIPLPPLPIQRKIAAVLSAYDDLIENNTRRIKILEEMASAIYREWFVEFRFPGHEQVEMVESELGLIPQGWEVRGLGDLCNVVPGYAFKSKDWQDTGVPVIKIKNIKSDNTIDTQDADHVSPKILLPKLNKYRLENGDFLIAMTGATAGKIGRLRTKTTMMLNQRVAKLDPIDGYRDYIWCKIALEETQKDFFRLADGAAQPNMSGSQIESYKIVCPPLSVCNHFSSIVGEILIQTDNLILRNNNLRQTRDLLLPKLISGEIDVSELDIDTD